MKATPAARVRRRRLARTVAVVATVAIVVGLTATRPAHSHTRAPSLASHEDAATAPMSPTATRASAVARTPRRSMRQDIRSYIATRDGAIGVAVYDSRAQRLIVIHPKMRGHTASIAKVDILETLLHRTRGHLSSSQRALAVQMIEHSDNDDATDLWSQAGGDYGIGAYNRELGMKQTQLNGYWSATMSSPRDQVTLIRTLFGGSKHLTGRARHFQRHLMSHVEGDQRWGIGDGVPKSATFGNKDGWSPIEVDGDRWAVNSIGWVRAATVGKSYEIAVMTEHEQTEGYGRSTIARISRIVWRHAATRAGG